MDHIILENKMADGTVFDIGALVRHFQQITDQRSKRGIRYSLPFLLVVIMMAKLAGQNKPSGIAEWVNSPPIPDSQPSGVTTQQLTLPRPRPGHRQR